MALLTRALAFCTVAACYTPDLRDCTVTCASAGDCALGQICGADDLCAGPGVQCSGHGVVAPDARRPDDAAPPMSDAPPPIDASIPMTVIHVAISGNGSVTLVGGATCSDDCDLAVPIGVPATLDADPAPHFDHWDGACSGKLPSCTLVPVMPVMTHASFK